VNYVNAEGFPEVGLNDRSFEREVLNSFDAIELKCFSLVSLAYHFELFTHFEAFCAVFKIQCDSFVSNRSSDFPFKFQK
jgi:hypothetical protein